MDTATATLPVRPAGARQQRKRTDEWAAVDAERQVTRSLARLIKRGQTRLRPYTPGELAEAIRDIHRRHPSIKTLADAVAQPPRPLTLESIRQLKARIRSEEKRRVAKEENEKIRRAIAERNNLFSTDVRTVLRRVLDRRRQATGIAAVRTGETTMEDDPQQVREITRSYFVDWTQARRSREPMADARWRHIYTPIRGVDQAWYDPLGDQVSAEELKKRLRELPNGKAAGVSGVTNEMLKHAGTDVHALMAAIFTACLDRQDVPEAWKVGVIHPIPKTPQWTGDLAQLRPITLLETVRKLFSLILTRRLQDVVEERGILRGGNFGFTRGRRTTDFVHVARAVVDDALLRKRHLELLLLDVRRAYDSVSWSSLEHSLRRIQLPQSYINLLANIFRSREAKVRTAHGTTEPFHPNTSFFHRAWRDSVGSWPMARSATKCCGASAGWSLSDPAVSAAKSAAGS